MKKTNVRTLQHNLRTILDEVMQGETIEITRRNEVVARIIPAGHTKQPEPWPDLQKRLDDIYGEKQVFPMTSDIIYEDRN